MWYDPKIKINVVLVKHIVKGISKIWSGTDLNKKKKNYYFYI